MQCNDEELNFRCDRWVLGEKEREKALIARDVEELNKANEQEKINQAATGLYQTSNSKTELASSTYFYHWDHLGTARLITDNSGKIFSTHDFEPYGVELPPFYQSESKILYTGQERDYYTNYDYMHFRFYASSMGRFLKPDNIIPDLTNPQNWNAYTYVKGNPVNFNDPSGHFISTPHSNDSAYMQGTHSFGMTWFDQFSGGWVPWFSQTEENSWYFGATKDASAYYHNQYLRTLKNNQSNTQSSSSVLHCGIITKVVTYFSQKWASLFSKNRYFPLISTLLSGADIFSTMFILNLAQSMRDINNYLYAGTLGGDIDIFGRGIEAWDAVLKSIAGYLERPISESEREDIIDSSQEIMNLKNDYGYTSYKDFFEEKEVVVANEPAILFMEAFEDAWRRRNI